MKALSGMAFAPTAEVLALAWCRRCAAVRRRAARRGYAGSTMPARESTADDGVYLTDVVSAFEPAEADAEEENEVAAPAPRCARRGIRLDVQIAQLGGILLPLRGGLKDHVVLVELRIEGVDLALAEGVVERVVDGGGRDAEARRGDAVDHPAETALAPGLLVGGHVFQLGQLLKLPQQTCRSTGSARRCRGLRACTGTGCG